MPENELVKQVGFIAGILAALTTFWWRVTSKFARKDVLAVHVKNFNATLERVETDLKNKGDAIGTVAKGQANIEGMLTVMMKNRNKRKDDE